MIFQATDVTAWDGPLNAKCVRLEMPDSLLTVLIFVISCCCNSWIWLCTSLWVSESKSWIHIVVYSLGGMKIAFTELCNWQMYKFSANLVLKISNFLLTHFSKSLKIIWLCAVNFVVFLIYFRSRILNWTWQDVMCYFFAAKHCQRVTKNKKYVFVCIFAHVIVTAKQWRNIELFCFSLKWRECTIVVLW